MTSRKKKSSLNGEKETLHACGKLSDVFSLTIKRNTQDMILTQKKGNHASFNIHANHNLRLKELLGPQ